MIVIIMAAGKSTRTHPLTMTRPKPLLKVANRTILEHQLDALHGIASEVVLVVGYRAEQIQKAFGDRYKDLPIRYVTQTEQRGTGHALLQCADVAQAPFMAVNGDDIFSAADLKALAETEQGALAKEVADPSLYGVYERGADGRAAGLTEKPENPVSALANMGAYRFTPEVFGVLREVTPSPRGEIEITSAIEVLINKGRFDIIEAHGFWLPIGYPWHLLEANEFLLNDALRPAIEGEVSPAAHVNGAVVIGRGSTVRPGAVIDGPAIIGRNCTIGPNCWIRPGTSIGDNCKAGQAVEIKNSILMDGAAVPHLSYVGDSVLGENVNLGCGTVTANFRHDGKNMTTLVKGVKVETGRRKLGAFLGDGVHTGVNTSIYPGRKLWPHVCTTPGQVVTHDIEADPDAEP